MIMAQNLYLNIQKTAKGKGKKRAKKTPSDKKSDEEGGRKSDLDYVEKAPRAVPAVPAGRAGAVGQKKGKPIATHSQMEKILASALFSVNVMNLFNPLKDIQFGKVNTRALVDAEAVNLQKAMTEQGMKPFSSENLIPIVIERRHVDATCIWTGVHAYDAPDLKLSEEGEQELTKMELAGRRHRLEAVRKIQEAKKKVLASARKKSSAQRKKRVRKDAAMLKRDKRLAEMEAEEEATENEIEELGRWGFALYDKGE